MGLFGKKDSGKSTSIAAQQANDISKGNNLTCEEHGAAAIVQTYRTGDWYCLYGADDCVDRRDGKGNKRNA